MAKVGGVDRLKRKLQAIPEVARTEIAKAMEESAAEIVKFARGLAPVEDGDLQRSIGWTWGDAPKGAIVLGSVRASKTGNMVITIYAGDDRAFYARWVEFGTKPHENGGLFTGSEHPGTAAQPFFYPAYRAVRRSVRGRVSRAVTKAAKRIAAA